MHKNSAPLFTLLALAIYLGAGESVLAQNQGGVQHFEQMLDSIDASPAKLPPVSRVTANMQTFPTVQNAAPQSSGNTIPLLNSTTMPANPLQRIMSFFNGQQQNGARMSGSGTAAGAKANGSNGSAGSENMYRAETQAGVAHNACSRSYYGDYYTRSQAADEAYYAAEEARHEADAAGEKAESGGANAEEYASTARAYAAQAQADADTARGNADSAYK